MPGMKVNALSELKSIRNALAERRAREIAEREIGRAHV